ncbi:hypothetical protein ACFXGT_20210 [Streptomyces sp. NPDC059352]|uniref:hypothetical protein n=1 Tax=Streptomyces sp. NPDC059352 TaxID=3346810 RepID=UPI0036817C01
MPVTLGIADLRRRTSHNPPTRSDRPTAQAGSQALSWNGAFGQFQYPTPPLGSYDSGFPDEYAFEDWLYRLEILSEDAEVLDQGEYVSGPAAGAYRHRITAANRQFAGHVLTSDRQARDLLGNPLLQIHHGHGMTCVFDPAQALCQIRGAVSDPLVTPDTDDCRPKCHNIARTDRDIHYLSEKHRELADLVADPFAPPIRHERELRELERLRRILHSHETGEGVQ